MAGRRPKPTVLKIIKGTARKSRLNPKEPQVIEGDFRKCPSWLCSEGQKEWKRISGKLKGTGILTELDRTAFTVLCQMWGEYVEGTKNKEPVSMAHITQMRLMAGEFGLTPSSRSKVEGIEPVSNELDPWDDL